MVNIPESLGCIELAELFNKPQRHYSIYDKGQLIFTKQGIDFQGERISFLIPRKDIVSVSLVIRSPITFFSSINRGIAAWFLPNVERASVVDLLFD